MKVPTVDEILGNRPSQHGEFEENSRCTWEIMRALQNERNWPLMKDSHRHALYMIAHKMARIMAGDPTVQDHWDDIAGYATCVATRLRSPVEPYNNEDPYAALARGWNTTPEDARERAIRYTQKHTKGGVPRTAEATMDRPGTPDDGGHHANQTLAEELEQGLEDELQR